MKNAYFLLVILFFGIATGGVYFIINETASINIFLPYDDTRDIETLVSVNGSAYSKEIKLINVSAGDVVELKFRHEHDNTEPIIGVPVYRITCLKGLTIGDGYSTGQILDFYDQDAFGDDVAKHYKGITYYHIDGDYFWSNFIDFIFCINDYTAEIRPPVGNISFVNSMHYTSLRLVFDENAYGEYIIEGFIEKPYVPPPVPCMLTDFETGYNTNYQVGGGKGYVVNNEFYTVKLPVVADGANGTKNSVQFTATAGPETQQLKYIDDKLYYSTIEESENANRLEMYVKMPPGWEAIDTVNLKIEIYTTLGDYNPHFVHYFNINGSDHWTKLILNQHPQFRTGQSATPANNPTMPDWDYFSEIRRYYFHYMADGHANAVGAWKTCLDEVRFYNETEPENTYSINSISCSYHDNGHFILKWFGRFRRNNPNVYEVRYSTEPINNSNYDTATIAPGCDNLISTAIDFKWLEANTIIPITSGTAYFAITDLTSDPGNCTRINYKIDE